jgi:hypothetical protein
MAVHRERRTVETAMHRSNTTELWIGSQRGASWQVSDALVSAFDDGDQMIAEDLAIVSKLLDITLRIPEHLTVAERRAIRELRLLLDGYCILVPEINGATVKLTKGTRAEVEDLVNRKGGMRFEGPLEFEIQSHSLMIEELYLFHESVHIVNKEEVIATFDDPEIELLTFKLESADGTPFRAFNPRLVPNPDSYMPPTPLEIEGVPEHPAIAQLTEQWQSHLDSCEQHERHAV